jgi:hypothetical protein
MKFIFTYFILFLLTLNANNISSIDYFSRALPLDEYIIKSSTSGKVDYVNSDIEGRTANNSLIIQLDDKINKIELQQLTSKLNILDKMILIESTNFNRINNISSKSKFDKDNQQLKVLNLKSTRTDLKIRIETLHDTIINKKFIETNRYIYNLKIKEGDFVNPGSTLYIAQDLSKAKLVIFIPIKYAKDIKEMIIYLNNKKTNYKISKLYNVADKEHLSTYRCEIIIDKPKNFSTLYKVEFK